MNATNLPMRHGLLALALVMALPVAAQEMDHSKISMPMPSFRKSRG